MHPHRGWARYNSVGSIDQTEIKKKKFLFLFFIYDRKSNLKKKKKKKKLYLDVYVSKIWEFI